MIATKLFSTDTPAMQAQLMNYTKNGYGIEIALYEYKPCLPETIEALVGLPEKAKMLHLWHQRVFLKGMMENIPEVWGSIEFEVGEAKRMGIRSGVLHHMTSLNKNGIGDMNNEDIAKYTRACIPALQRINDLGLKPYLENTHEKIHFHKTFYRTLEEEGVLPLVGFCLDTGHTRVFAKESLDDWLDFVASLVQRNVDIHYHIHVNHGELDEHMTLCRGEQEQLLEPIPGWNTEGFLKWFNRALVLTPNALFCQEHSSQDAAEAISYIEFLAEDGLLLVDINNKLVDINKKV
jgi:hypothetical protein